MTSEMMNELELQAITNHLDDTADLLAAARQRIAAGESPMPAGQQWNRLNQRLAKATRELNAWRDLMVGQPPL